jgi:DNA-binding transcriptional LysR family regulator
MANEAYEIMDLKALRCFWATGKRGSLTQAGIELGISEAAVSQRVKSLERYLGAKLYEARGGRIRLTAAGERTMELAISIFDELDDFERTVASGEESVNITLCTHDTALRHLIPEAVAQFSREHPLARLRLLARSIEDSIRLVRTNEADIGIIPERDVPRDLIFERIATYPAVLILPRGHPLTRRGRADFHSLLDEETVRRYPLVVSEVQLEGHLLKDALDRLGLPLNVGIEVSTIDTLKHYVALGLGIAVISGVCLTDDDRAQLEVLEVPADISADTTYGLIVRQDKHRSTPLETLIRLVKGA